MTIFGLLVLLGLFCGLGKTADVLQGYLIYADDTTPTCFKIDGDTPRMVQFTASFAECTLIKVSQPGGNSDRRKKRGTPGYFVEDASDNAKKITFASSDDTTPATLTSTGSEFKFIRDGNRLENVEDITGSSNAFTLDRNVGVTGSDCVLGDLTYTNTDSPTTCDDVLFYFELAACSDTNCKTCVPDPAVCSECEDNAPMNSAMDECVACSGSPSCTECTLDGNDAIQCSACGDDKIVAENACVACPENQKANADGTCDVLQGYLIFDADPETCFKVGNDNSITMDSYTDVSSDCRLVKVSGYSANGFIIQVADDATKQLSYSGTTTTAGTLSATGTALKFIRDGNELSTAAALIDNGNPFMIDQHVGDATGEDCLTGTLGYTNTDDPNTCTDLLFYFVQASCTGTNCKDCLPDPGLCSECENNEVLNTAGTECLVCPDGQIPNSAGTDCEVCPDGQIPNSAGTDCEATTDSASDVILPSIILITMVTMMGKQILG